jgi:hypothetical protein
MHLWNSLTQRSQLKHKERQALSFGSCDAHSNTHTHTHTHTHLSVYLCCKPGATAELFPRSPGLEVLMARTPHVTLFQQDLDVRVSNRRQVSHGRTQFSDRQHGHPSPWFWGSYGQTLPPPHTPCTGAPVLSALSICSWGFLPATLLLVLYQPSAQQPSGPVSFPLVFHESFHVHVSWSGLCGLSIAIN